VVILLQLSININIIAMQPFYQYSSLYPQKAEESEAVMQKWLK
jgi:hypothetical protein